MLTFAEYLLLEKAGEPDLTKHGTQEYSHGKASVIVGVHPTKPEIDLISLRVPQRHRRQGHASQALANLTAHADRHGKTVKLLASPLDKKTHLGKLVSFYQRHGFELTGKTGNPAQEPYMERKPKK